MIFQLIEVINNIVFYKRFTKKLMMKNGTKNVYEKRKMEEKKRKK